jgi:hypothetical protein
MRRVRDDQLMDEWMLEKRRELVERERDAALARCLSPLLQQVTVSTRFQQKRQCGSRAHQRRKGESEKPIWTLVLMGGN